MKKLFFLLFSLMLMLGAKQVSGTLTGVSWSATSYEPGATNVTYTFLFTTTSGRNDAAYLRLANSEAAWTLTATSYNATGTGGSKTIFGDEWTSMPTYVGYKIQFAALSGEFWDLGVLGEQADWTITIDGVTNGVAGTYPWTEFAIYAGGGQLIESGTLLDLPIAEGGTGPGGSGGGGGGGGGGAAPTVTTNSTATNITMNSATLGGNATDGVDITDVGVAFGTDADPTTPGWSMGEGQGPFSDVVSNLTPNTLYHYRAYATNSEGTSYGDDYTFTTLPDKPADPTGVSGPNSKICPGSQTQLTAQGAEGTVYWYTGGCGSSQVGSPGNPITVSPSITTTYYARNFNNDLYSDGCASITVNVEQPLTLSCPGNFDVNTDPDVCTASVTFAATAGGTPTPVLTYKVNDVPITSPYDFPKGTTTVDVTAENICSNLDCSFTVTVTDNQNPLAVTKDIPSIQLDLSGNVSIDPELDINDGSSDNCGIETYELDKSAFTPTDKGNNVVTLTVTDEQGNDDSETANVFVENIPSPFKWRDTHVNANGFSDYDFDPNNPTFLLKATGQSSTTNDVFHFVYDTMGTVGTIIARLADVDNGGWAGVMIRESCEPNAKTILFKTRLYNPNVIIGYRTSTGSAMRNLSQVAQLIHWMKIQRNGNTFKVFTSYNGTTWLRRYTGTISMEPQILAGIFTESILSNRTSIASFDNVEVSGQLKTGDEFAEAEIIIPDSEEAEVSVYPNPAKDVVNIITKGFQTLQGFGTLITADGKTVKTFTISGSETQIDVTNLNPGLYVLKIELEESITVKRVIIE